MRCPDAIFSARGRARRHVQVEPAATSARAHRIALGAGPSSIERPRGALAVGRARPHSIARDEDRQTLYRLPFSIVTGANRGIGLALVAALRERGHAVLAACRTSSPALAQIGAEVVDGVDVSTDQGIAALVAAVGTRSVDLLINNAGNRGESPIMAEVHSFDPWLMLDLQGAQIWQVAGIQSRKPEHATDDELLQGLLIETQAFTPAGTNLETFEMIQAVQEG